MYYYLFRKRRKKRDAELAKGGRRPGSTSDYSYRSFVSAGGTRHVKRKKRKPGGGYEGDSESYHSDEDEEGIEGHRMILMDLRLILKHML